MEGYICFTLLEPGDPHKNEKNNQNRDMGLNS